MSARNFSLDVALEDYHSSPMLSTSKLKDFEQLGAHGFYSKHVIRTTPVAKDREALIFGQVFEDIAQGRGFNADGKLVIKDREFRSKEDKKWRDDHLAAGHSFVTEEEIDSCMAMRAALEENETAVQMVNACVQQATLRAGYAGTPGIQSRPDWISADGCLASGYAPFTLDLKSTKSLLDIASGRGVISFRYDAQGAIAREAWGVLGSRHYLLACEKTLPFRCQVIELTPEWLDQGWRWAERQMQRLAKHYASGLWPRVEREMVALPSPPSWGDKDQYVESEDDLAA